MTAVELRRQMLSRDEARSLTDEVKHDAERLWRKLVELYDGGAHLALGYTSWGTYFETEFGGSDATAYRLLQSGRVMAQLPIGSSTPANEGQARELVPLLDDPELMQEAWKEAMNATNGQPTAAAVKTAVKRRTITEEARLEMLALRRQGKKMAEIATMTGWSPAAVSRALTTPKSSGRLPRRHQAGSSQTRALAKLHQTCREWEEIGDEDYIPAPEVARRIRVLDGCLVFLTAKRDRYREVSPSGGRSNA